MAETLAQRRARSGSIQQALNNIEHDKSHHLTGGMGPQTPLTATSRMGSPPPKMPPVPKPAAAGLWSDILTMQWMRVPASSLKLLAIGAFLYVNWSLVAPQFPNPFEHLLFISGRVPSSPPDDPRYAKSYYDLLFIAYYIIFFSFVRQSISLYVCIPFARYFGIKQEAKLDRFAEQGYAVIYFSVMGLWGVHVMSGLPTWWYDTKYFWIDYPHWDMKPELKYYYLIQTAYWCQQFLVLALRMEKPRKDYNELIAHHFVTLWLIGWSYLINLTLIGNAVYLSMDLPDAILAFSKCLNYLRREIAKSVAFAVLVVTWSYFRHWLNLVMLYSVWFEFDLLPETSKRWHTPDGVWLTWWMKYQIFTPLVLLQCLNLFWYFLIWRILFRALFGSGLDDERSDDEGDSDESKKSS